MTEILAPAGSFDSLKAAVNAGADAVYMGGALFGARAYAENFTKEEALRGMEFAHLHQKKVYLTVNTLLKEDEKSEQLYDYLLPYYREGLDAVIVQDLGVLSFIKRNFPKLPIHASTQMSVAGVYGARCLEQMGVSRIVVPRELSLSEIKNISEGTGLEIEAFIHGALCYCYSGQCLLSSFIGGRSGNRGRCAQPCRMAYDLYADNSPVNIKDERYLLSPRDLCALKLLPDCVDAGVYSFKIEGRMKKPEYVAGVVSIYRKYMDMYLENGRKGFQITEEDVRNLADLYSRGGFTDGYFKRQNGRELLALKRPNHQGVPVGKVSEIKSGKVTVRLSKNVGKGDILELPYLDKNESNFTVKENTASGKTLIFLERRSSSFKKGMEIFRIRNQILINELLKKYVETEKKEKIDGFVQLLKHKPAVFQLQYRDEIVAVTGDTVTEAVNRPLTEDVVKKQFSKMGNTLFQIDSLDIRMDDDIFLGVQSMNELRRKCVEELKEKILKKYRRRVDVEEISFSVKGSHMTVSQMETENIPDSSNTKYTALISRMEQLKPVLDCEKISEVYIESSLIPVENLPEIAREVARAGKKLYYALPYIFRKQAVKYFEEKDSYRLDILNKTDGIGYLVRNMDACEFFGKKAPKEMIFDFSCHQMNSEAGERWLALAGERGVRGVRTTISPELNEKELLNTDIVGKEFIFYGRIPVMISAGCLAKTCTGCKSGDKKEWRSSLQVTGQTGKVQMKDIGQLMWLKDRKGMEFPVENVCRYCYNIMWNSVPLFIDEKEERLDRFKFGALRYHFTVESEEETKQILTGLKPLKITRGHFHRQIL